MRNYYVILTGSEDSWQAGFTGYDLAVRGGTRLAGTIPAELAEGVSASRLLNEFTIGARASGASFFTHRLASKGKSLVTGLPSDADGVLIGRSDLASEGDLHAIMEELACPLWIVHSQLPLVNALALRQGPIAGHFTSQADRMARMWGWRLETIDVGSTTVGDEGAEGTIAGQPAKVQVGADQFIQRLSSEPADLTMLAWPSQAVSCWDLLHRSDRLMILIPGT
jgi:hypothetical protein